VWLAWNLDTRQPQKNVCFNFIWTRKIILSSAILTRPTHFTSFYCERRRSRKKVVSFMSSLENLIALDLGFINNLTFTFHFRICWVKKCAWISQKMLRENETINFRCESLRRRRHTFLIRIKYFLFWCVHHNRFHYLAYGVYFFIIKSLNESVVE
jgi:hypothetical protein